MHEHESATTATISIRKWLWGKHGRELKQDNYRI